MKLVSIVLPTHNRADLLPSAIESVRRQTYPQWELIVVDDCSSDDTPHILEKLAKEDSRIKVFRNDPNLRLPKSLNRGFNEAKGDLLTWTSDDNLYHPQAIQVMVDVLESEQADLAYADMAIIDSDGDKVGFWQGLPPDQVTEKALCGACFLYRKELADRVGPYAEDLFLAEDYDYWIRCSLLGKLVHIPQELYDYREHDASLSSQYTEKVGYVMAEVLARHVDDLSLTDSKRADIHLAIADAARKQRKQKVLREHAIKALKLNPKLALSKFKRGLLACLIP